MIQGLISGEKELHFYWRQQPAAQLSRRCDIEIEISLLHGQFCAKKKKKELICFSFLIMKRPWQSSSPARDVFFRLPQTELCVDFFCYIFVDHSRKISQRRYIYRVHKCVRNIYIHVDNYKQKNSSRPKYKLKAIFLLTLLSHTFSQSVYVSRREFVDLKRRAQRREKKNNKMSMNEE